MIKHYHINIKEDRLTFLEYTKIRGIEDLLPLTEPSDLQRRAPTDPTLQNHHLALRCLNILQQLTGEETHNELETIKAFIQQHC